MVPLTGPFDPVMMSTVALEGDVSTTPVTLIASGCPLAYCSRLFESRLSGRINLINDQSAFSVSVAVDTDRAWPRTSLPTSNCGGIPKSEPVLSEATCSSFSLAMGVSMLIEGPESSESKRLGDMLPLRSS